MQRPYRQAIGSVLLSLGALIAAHFMLPFEGQNLRAYQDGGGVYTICNGHTQGVKAGDVATKQQCHDWYIQDIQRAETSYDNFVKTKNPANVQAAMISFIFNTGPEHFRTSTMLKKLNKGDPKGACNELLKWHYMDGKDCTIESNNCYGIVVRRQAERSLCLDANYYSSYHLNPDNVFVGVRPTQSSGQPR